MRPEDPRLRSVRLLHGMLEVACEELRFAAALVAAAPREPPQRRRAQQQSHPHHQELQQQAHQQPGGDAVSDALRPDASDLRALDVRGATGRW